MSPHILAIAFNIVLYSKLTTAQYYSTQPTLTVAPMPYPTLAPTALPYLTGVLTVAPISMPIPAITPTAIPMIPLPPAPTPIPTLAPVPVSIPPAPLSSSAPKCFPATASAYLLPAPLPPPKVTVLPTSCAPTPAFTPALPLPPIPNKAIQSNPCPCSKSSSVILPPTPCPVLPDIKEIIGALVPAPEEILCVLEEPALFLPPPPAEPVYPGIFEKPVSSPCESCKLKFDQDLLNGFLLGLGISG